MGMGTVHYLHAEGENQRHQESWYPGRGRGPEPGQGAGDKRKVSHIRDMGEAARRFCSLTGSV